MGLMQSLRRLVQRHGAINCEETRVHAQYDRTFNLFQLVARFVHYVLRLFGRIKARRWLTFQLTKVNAEAVALEVFTARLAEEARPICWIERTNLRRLASSLQVVPEMMRNTILWKKISRHCDLDFLIESLFSRNKPWACNWIYF